MARRFTKSDIVKFVGLVAFLAIVTLIVVELWPYIKDAFSEDGLDSLVAKVQSAGPVGVAILLGMEVLQVIVAFIPGEVIQVAAGLMYGPWLGALIVFIGCVLSTALVFALVRWLGAPFVRDMVPMGFMKRFQQFERNGKLNVVVFVLYLIPGLPKDIFTYLIPLTDMSFSSFLIIANVARIPGILASTFVASGIASGDYLVPVIIAVVIAVIAGLAVLFRDQLIDVMSTPAFASFMNVVESVHDSMGGTKPANADEQEAKPAEAVERSSEDGGKAQKRKGKAAKTQEKRSGAPAVPGQAVHSGLQGGDDGQS